MSGGEVYCERPGGLSLKVSRSDGGSFYVALYSRPRRTGRWRAVAAVYGALAREVALTKCEGQEDWTLEAEGARFTLTETEAHRITAAFPGINCRMYPRSQS